MFNRSIDSFRERALTCGALARGTLGLGAAVLVGLLLACEGKLPEPESRPAKLYVQYCSAKGCHGPIPPGRDVANYWKLQTDRMLGLMREQGFALPSPEEEGVIRAYLTKYAEK